MWWGGGGSDPEPVEEVMCSFSQCFLLSKFLGIDVVEKLALQLFMFIRILEQRPHPKTEARTRLKTELHLHNLVHSLKRIFFVAQILIDC